MQPVEKRQQYQYIFPIAINRFYQGFFLLKLTKTHSCEHPLCKSLHSLTNLYLETFGQKVFQPSFAKNGRIFVTENRSAHLGF